MWDPARYRQFGAERSRPFHELVARVGVTEPGFVADLGCGPGELTAGLCERWPTAEVLGVDNSAEMIAAAGKVVAGLQDGLRRRLRFELADVSDWKPARPVDVVVSNAMLQWLPEHEKLLSRWAGYLAPGGWLAFAVPGNFDEPTHRLLRELAALPRWRDPLAGVAFNRQAADPAEYLDLLAREGCAVDAWETTYLQVLEGDDPVLRWYKGTGLRPVIAALDDGQATEFMAEYGALLAEHYPRRPYGTVLPFRRVFVVAQLMR
ncbi:MAG: trans-aconitate 2-methyltransferase [Nocardiopsaceae bacterium]|jgi:trans-aconitate 2-methyltransferase|nr:trans-aconitate 2-methyltransferase [Nocardiopsaceae bacterium]